MLAIVFAAVLVLVLPLFAACAPKAAPKPEVTSVRVASFQGLTGPAAVSSMEMYDFYVMYVKWINEEQGGISAGGKKYKIDWVTFDTGYTVPRAMVLLKQTSQEGFPLLAMQSSSEVTALKPMIGSAKIPCFTGAIGEPVIVPPGWVYGVTPGYPAGFGLGIDWIAKNWKESRPPNIGFLTWDSAYGRAIMTDECLAYAKSKGCNIVGQEFHGAAPTDLTPQLMKLKDAGVDFIFSNNTSPQIDVMVRQAAELGITPKVKLMASVHSYEVNALDRIGAKNGAGWMAVMDTPWFTDKNDPGAQLMNKMRAKYRPGETAFTKGPKSLPIIAVMKEVFKRTIEAVGPDKVTGANCKQYGIDTIKNWKDPDGILPAISYAADDQVGLKKLRYMDVIDGVPTITSDWVDVPPLGWGKK